MSDKLKRFKSPIDREIIKQLVDCLELEVDKDCVYYNRTNDNNTIIDISFIVHNQNCRLIITVEINNNYGAYFQSNYITITNLKKLDNVIIKVLQLEDSLLFKVSDNFIVHTVKLTILRYNSIITVLSDERQNEQHIIKKAKAVFGLFLNSYDFEPFMSATIQETKTLTKEAYLNLIPLDCKVLNLKRFNKVNHELLESCICLLTESNAKLSKISIDNNDADLNGIYKY